MTDQGWTRSCPERSAIVCINLSVAPRRMVLRLQPSPAGGTCCGAPTRIDTSRKRRGGVSPGDGGAIAAAGPRGSSAAAPRLDRIGADEPDGHDGRTRSHGETHRTGVAAVESPIARPGSFWIDAYDPV